MKSLYNDAEAKKYKIDLDLRVYTSRLLGADTSLVLHGGGNTSVKSTATDSCGDVVDVLLVKGSGWDLETIKAEGFASVRMDALLKMAELKELSDKDMVKGQRAAMIDQSAPNPSVEAILHAIIPFKFVDHTHADAVVTITNTQNGEEKIKELFGEKVLIIPYIMPGFVLAKLVYEMTRDVDWNSLEGIVLMNHGLFTFSDDAKISYEKTIELVDMAENYLFKRGAVLDIQNQSTTADLLELAKIRKEVSLIKESSIISVLNDSKEAIYFSKQNIEKIAIKGPLTPDHVIRTKRVPVILTDEFEKELQNFVEDYKQYFLENKKDEILLNPAPNFAILKGKGSLSFGKNAKEANIIKDINNHSFEAILKAEKLGGYKALGQKEIFEVEYWSLEQAKLKKSSDELEYGGKIVIIVDAVDEKAREKAFELSKKGAVVIAIDTNCEVEKIFSTGDIIGVKCDTDSDEDIKSLISFVVKSFGGIDMLIADKLQYKKLAEECTPFLELS
ncbi:class II aldolase/adducin family protein [Sulfurimonas sp.]|uniref:class II aldolase/adducin family protein n=1 Tax=Sulfurimonas sp. TaxID=2022749 RepID=UPI0025D94287|nr:class II aldolase/adducin family protein [Sulfurimonas sp.]MDD5157596.1 class II aldolase/adducin family protein [Sulfurimonas sp.]